MNPTLFTGRPGTGFVKGLALLLACIVLFVPVALSADTSLKGKWATAAGRYLDAAETRAINSVNPLYETMMGGFGGSAGPPPPAMETQRGVRGAGKGKLRGGTSARGPFRGNRNFQVTQNAIRGTGSPSRNPFENGGAGNNGLTDGLALIMELKVDKKSKLTGSMTVYIYDGKKVVKQKAKIEDAVVADKAFTFTTNHKFGDVIVPNTWKGEQTSENTIRISRLKPSGELLEPIVLVFQRML